jgi:hypothetical protein
MICTCIVVVLASSMINDCCVLIWMGTKVDAGAVITDRMTVWRLRSWGHPLTII